MRKIEAELEMIPLKLFKAKRGFNGKVQQYFTEQVYKFSEPYTPRDTGTFLSNVTLGEDYILYNSPFSNYLWNGKKFVDPEYKIGAFYSSTYGFWSRPGILKEETDINLNYKGAPMRGPYWTNRMWVDKDKEILTNVQKFIDSGGKNG